MLHGLTAMMKPYLVLLTALAVSGPLLAGCTPKAATPVAAPSGEADRAELIRLNEELVRTQIVDRDSVFFSALAVDEFRVLAPGGMIEGKAQAIAGLAAWNATAVELTGTEVVFHGPVALVMGRMDIDGEMRPVGRWGPLKYMSTWVHEGGTWRLVSRSLTPCLARLVEMDRC